MINADGERETAKKYVGILFSIQTKQRNTLQVYTAERWQRTAWCILIHHAPAALPWTYVRALSALAEYETSGSTLSHFLSVDSPDVLFVRYIGVCIV